MSEKRSSSGVRKTATLEVANDFEQVETGSVGSARLNANVALLVDREEVRAPVGHVVELEAVLGRPAAHDGSLLLSGIAVCLADATARPREVALYSASCRR